MLAYTTNQIAVALGIKRQAAQWALRNVPADGLAVVNGNQTSAWSRAAIPAQLNCKLDAAAVQGGYRNAEALLAAPPAIYPPKDFPALDTIAPEEIDRAGKLRQALGPLLHCQHDDSLSSAEFEARGVAEYKCVFGHSISARYWRDLFKRTLRRDAGQERFARLELYLPDKPALKNPVRRAGFQPAFTADELAEFAELTGYLDAIPNPSKPSKNEQREVWTLAVEQHGKLVGRGVPASRAARRVRAFLFTAAPFLAASRNALRMAFERRLARWQNGKGDPKSQRDGRAENGEKFDFPEADRDLLIHRAVFNYRGDVAPAWRDCLRQRFSETVRERYTTHASRKSYVPARIMDSIGPEVEIFTVMHRGPRAFDSIKGFVSRNYDNLHSLQCFQADDFTMNCYFFIPDGNGWFNLTRGQVILFIDFRSLRILGWALEPRKSYSSLTIRSLCTHVFGAFGVPEVLYFERGLWKSATLLTGKNDPFTFTEISQGLREFGIKFIHAIRPRSKTVERVGGLFQDLAEGEPGYCGRDERRDAPESLRKQMAEVEARKVHPSRYFYSLDQWNKRIGELVARYNGEPQQGKILAGLSPEAGFEAHLNQDNPPMQFSAALRYLLAHDKRPARVTLNGVTIQIGKQKFNYRGLEIAHLVGRDVLAWFDPENLDTLTVTNLDRENPICVARSQSPDALEMLTAPDSGTLGRELKRVEEQASYMKTRFNIVKASFPLPERKALTDAQTVELGQEMELQKSRVRSTVVRTQRRRHAAGRFARDTGVAVRDPDNFDGDDDDARFLKSFLNPKKESDA
ncbi:MAG: hypothetical protein IH623_09490 [Verrucomicrobia bacterium]|nr:hypothetical protein [Verrucomicrobiota bacterium]